MSATPRDYYGPHAAQYRKFRPTYPESLFEQLLRLAPDHQLAWDCGTGNGQVAVRLAQDFEQVWATDLSEKQLRQAQSHPRVSYHQGEAHQSGLSEQAVSLVTVATAVHWFDHEPFYREVRRVLAPGGVLAVWTYGPTLIAPAPLAEIVDGLSRELEADWPEGIQWVQKEYLDLPFPFPSEELEPLEFLLDWSIDELFGWVGTWSAVHRNRGRTSKEPLSGVRRSLEKAWPAKLDQKVRLRLPLYYRVGRNDGHKLTPIA